MNKNSISRTDIINRFIQLNGYKTYLEIGVQTGKNFKEVICDEKVGVDPCLPDEWNPTVVNMEPTFKMTSDEFFQQNKRKFDIIFIDGLHHWKQVVRDIEHALVCLNPDGVIICHDMNPPTEEAQLVPRVQRIWNGDCWRAWIHFRMFYKKLNMYVINTDEGCGIIQKSDIGQQLLQIPGSIDYENLAANRVQWLNLREPQI